METCGGARRLPQILMVAFCALSAVSVAGAFAADGSASRVDEPAPSGSRVFGVTVSGDGSALPGVLISLSGNGVKQKTVSETDGAFSFASVPPGDYVVVFQIQGKKRVKRKIPVSTEDVDLGTIVVD